MAGGFQKFQNAGQNGAFSSVEVGTGTADILVLLLAFVLLIALISSERRYRVLRERFANYPLEKVSK
jgi:hypothetical protein